MKEKFNKETAKKVVIGCGVFALNLILTRCAREFGFLSAYADIAARGYHIADKAGNIVEIAK